MSASWTAWALPSPEAAQVVFSLVLSMRGLRFGRVGTPGTRRENRKNKPAAALSRRKSTNKTKPPECPRSGGFVCVDADKTSPRPTRTRAEGGAEVSGKTVCQGTTDPSKASEPKISVREKAADTRRETAAILYGLQGPAAPHNAKRRCAASQRCFRRKPGIAWGYALVEAE